MDQSTEMKTRDFELFAQKLKESLGAGKVKDDELVLVTYASDISTFAPQKPSLVIFPETRDDVVEVLQRANEYKVPVTVMSTGVNVAGSCIPDQGGIVLDLRRMDKIIGINTDSGYATVEPGVNFDRLTAALREKGYRCQIPTAPGGASVLANYMSRPTASLCNKHIDSIVDLEVVLPDGTVLDTGSSHFPNATSHLRYGPFPDLAGLFLCAYGTLGVVTKGALRIYPINESNRVNLAAFDRFEDSVDYIKDLINNNIPEHCIIWNWQLAKTFEVGLVDNQYKVPPESRLDPRKPPEGIPYNFVTTFMSGYEEVMEVNERICSKVAQKYGGRVLGKEEAEELIPTGVLGWTELYGNYRPVEPTFFGLGQYLVWIVLVEPDVVKDLEKWAVEEYSMHNSPPVCYYAQPFDFGRSMFFRIFLFADPKDRKLVDRIVTRNREMFDEAIKRYGGVPMRVKGGYPPLEVSGGYGAALLRIKEALDPNNILRSNTKLFGGMES